MNSQPLYDLSPVLHVMLMGIAVALGPLSWLWMRNAGATSAQRLRALTLITLFLTFDLVLFGAFTRLTDSGLGCPDWPGCYGNASPQGAHEQITQAQAAMPTGPVTHAKAWIEMIHRYLATGVGVLILTLTIASWVERRKQRAPISPWWPVATLVWVCLQGAFGALTVTMKLFPAIVTLHLLGGLVLLALLAWQATLLSASQQGQPAALSGPDRALLVTGFAVLWVQVALGGWVSTNYAVLACAGFPTCQASWWPAMDFAQGFSLWRPLGQLASGESITFEALTAIHYVHRLMAYAVFVVLGALAVRLYRQGVQVRAARGLGGLLLLQAATGLSNVVLGWPLLGAVLHTGGAAALVVVLSTVLCGSRRREPRSSRSAIDTRGAPA